MTQPPVDSIWNWNSFSGGEGDGFFYGPEGSYRSGSNIDTRMLENGVRCTNALTTLSTYDGDILSINKYESNCFSTRLSNTGKIYYGGAFKFNMSSGTTAHDMIAGWGKMIRNSDNTMYSYGFSQTSFGEGKVHKFDANFGGVTYAVGTFTLPYNNPNNSLSGRLPTVNYPGGIVFGYSNGVYNFSNTETVTLKLTFPINCDIVGITYYQNQWKVYYNVQRFSSGTIDSRIGIWDGESTALSQYVQFDNSAILSVTNDGDKDYVAFGGSYTADLYLVQGLSRQPLRINVEQSTGNSRKLGGSTTMREGILYTTGSNKNTNGVLYSYGKYYNGTNNSLVPENLGEFDGLNTTEQSLYIYNDDGVSNGVGQVSVKSIFFSGVSEALGTIVSYPQIGQGIDTIKTIKELRVAYDLANNDNSIKIYARKDKNCYDNNTSGWILLKTITDNTKKGVKINRNELVSLELGDFYSLEYKVELVQPFSSDSPIFYGIKTTFTDNLK